LFGSDLTLQLAGMRLLAGLIIATVHGATIAAAAVLLGDKGPRYDGRLTLLPFRHVDLVGLASLVLSGFGWSRPVAIDATQLRWGRWGLVVATLAGSIALLVLAYVLARLSIPLLQALPYTAGLGAAAFVRVASRLSMWLALLALLPLPPLAGAHFLAALGIRLPASAGVVIAWGLLLASLFGLVRIVLAPAYGVIAPLILGPDLAT
jgi:Zn-dependent protease